MTHFLIRVSIRLFFWKHVCFRMDYWNRLFFNLLQRFFLVSLFNIIWTQIFFTLSFGKHQLGLCVKVFLNYLWQGIFIISKIFKTWYRFLDSWDFILWCRHSLKSWWINLTFIPDPQLLFSSSLRWLSSSLHPQYYFYTSNFFKT